MIKRRRGGRIFSKQWMGVVRGAENKSERSKAYAYLSIRTKELSRERIEIGAEIEAIQANFRS